MNNSESTTGRNSEIYKPDDPGFRETDQEGF